MSRHNRPDHRQEGVTSRHNRPGRRRGGAPSPVDRLTRAAVTAAARRWPPELADDLRAAWLAELATLTDARRKIAFAGSLAVSPAVDEPSWAERAARCGRHAPVAAGVTLLAAALANTARAAGGLAPLVLVVAVGAMVTVGARVRVPVALVGAALFAFLWVGNPVPVMPFMGAADIAPAVVAWTVGTALTVRSLRRRPGRRWRRAVGGGLSTLVVATAAGSVHAAAELGVAAWTAPAWFPLALLPGDSVSFGPSFAAGSASFGPVQVYGDAHASDILLANAAVTAGPMLLSTALLLAAAAGRRAASTGHTPVGRWAASARRTAARRWAAPARRTIAGRSVASAGRTTAGHGRRRETLVGLGAALAALAVAPLLPAGGPADAMAGRLLDNSMTFGFGFAAHPAGQGALALLVALLAMRAAGQRNSPA